MGYLLMGFGLWFVFTWSLWFARSWINDMRRMIARKKAEPWNKWIYD